MGFTSHDTYGYSDQYILAYENAQRTRNYKYFQDLFPPGTQFDKMEGTPPDSGVLWSHTICPERHPGKSPCHPICHRHDLVVAVDGGCRGNGTALARAAISVFFGNNNSHNFMGVLDFDPEPTNQKAELGAAIKALEIVRQQNFVDDHEDIGGLRSIVIKSDSAYVVNSLTQYITKWRWNGFVNAKGFSVKNRELLQYLDDLVIEVEDKHNVDIFFWHVPRRYNEAADRLVNYALDADIGRPKVYVVGPRLTDWPWFLEMYEDVLDLLRRRADVIYIRTTKNLHNLVEGPNTRFLFVDHGCLSLKSRHNMSLFAERVCLLGSYVAFGALLPDLCYPADITAMFRQVFNLPWRVGDYNRVTVLRGRPCAWWNARGLVRSDQAEALCLQDVPARQRMYLVKGGLQVYAACTKLSTKSASYVGYIGEINTGLLFSRAVVAMLGLPPVYDDVPERLLTAATRVREDTLFLDHRQDNF